jgi:hypothetical protein
MRHEDTSARRILVMILTLTAVGFLLWLVAVFSIWLVLGSVGVSTSFWDLMQALSPAVAAGAVFGAGYVTYSELREFASTRHIAVADRLFEELNSPEAIEARRWIFEKLPPNPQEGVHSLTPEGRDAVKLVLNSLDRVAFLTQAGWIPEDMIMPWMNPMIVKAWAKLEPYVTHESRRRHEPDYYEHARKLAERCRAWRAEHLPEAEITWVDDAL